MAYFPAAIAGAAAWSQKAMKQHKLEKLGHDRTKSSDHADCVPRHMMDAGDIIAAFERGEISFQEVKCVLDEADAAFWRVGAWSQQLHERFGGAPMAPAAFIPPTVPAPPSPPADGIPEFLRAKDVL
jgi:hypothetical protein